jgi:GNAT superfamily N-acetyltransferase
MFLRGNIRRAGLDYKGGAFEAQYVGGFEDDRLAAVAGHCWNGVLLLQAPSCAAPLAVAVTQWSGRRVTGFSGPVDAVREARTALQLNDAAAVVDADEDLYALDLDELIVPAALASGEVACRAPRADEHDLLRAWRVAYDIEALGSPDSLDTRRRAHTFLDAQLADGHAWIAVHDGRPASLAAFNAALPDIVQLGGIYTPPALRGRGFARAAVAASLVAARHQGVTRAVLFTKNPSAARSYEAVGFRRVGSYGLIMLKTGSRF